MDEPNSQPVSGRAQIQTLMQHHGLKPGCACPRDTPRRSSLVFRAPACARLWQAIARLAVRDLAPPTKANAWPRTASNRHLEFVQITPPALTII